MFGKLLGSVIQVATLPVDAVNIAVDMATGGSGSKRSRTQGDDPASMLEILRDRVVETCKEIDK